MNVISLTAFVAKLVAPGSAVIKKNANWPDILSSAGDRGWVSQLFRQGCAEEIEMLQSDQVEELLILVSSLNRDALVTHLQTYRASFPVDFTADYLNRLPVDKLRHIFVGMCLQSQRMPDSLCHAA